VIFLLKISGRIQQGIHLILDSYLLILFITVSISFYIWLSGLYPFGSILVGQLHPEIYTSPRSPSWLEYMCLNLFPKIPLNFIYICCDIPLFSYNFTNLGIFPPSFD
jgi:hypothetical protein